ncbi:unnamed protein product [Acanthoscelides obtectus]|nr:unnamed protein product [Acanthoscelides obtectus]CAK1652747.1 Juvenile hormone epoxide hydrolase 2 [Acanthoscelides obtectus]
MNRIFVCSIAIFVVYIGWKVNDFMVKPPLPEVEDKWWGPGTPRKVDNPIRNFTIQIPDEVLEDLKYRLDHHRSFTPPLEGIQHQYGFNTNLLKKIVDFWRMKYNWREREKYLNKYPQFKVNVDGLDVHFIHVKPDKVPEGVKVLPLLLVHGWPGSVREFYDILPKLTTPREGYDFVFEVVAPHIPGYGFSQAAVRPGLGPEHIGHMFKKLMEKIGHKKFYMQAGDFGHIILQHLAIWFPDSVLGFHSNFCVVMTPTSYIKHLVSAISPSFPWYVRPDHYDRVFPIKEKIGSRLRETGYLHIQATRPDTLGVGINDSPVGLAAYILEKFIVGTNNTFLEREDGGLEEYYTYTDLIDNLMIYWVTGSATTSFRLYAETFNKEYFASPFRR